VVTAAWPANLFPIDSRAHRYLLISGGIGITPMLSYLPVLAARGVPFELHHLCRADERPAFAELLAPYAGVHIHSGRAGFDLDAILVRQRLGTHLATCGPRTLMDALFDRARALGWPDSNLHRESFGADGGAPLRVTLVRSGRAIEVAADQTILEALEAAGLTPNCLCRGGACGACLTAVLDGEPEHRDDFLDDEERQSGRMMMICVSRARGPALVLDV
jgi:ferredoxin-NADP reductase